MLAVYVEECDVISPPPSALTFGLEGRESLGDDVAFPGNIKTRFSPQPV